MGWSGAATVEDAEIADIFKHLAARDNLRMRAVSLSHEEIDGFYQGFSNGIIWPLFHDILKNCNFNPTYWPIYCRVNRKFAEVLARETTPNDFLWVHDYHLMLLGQELSRLQLPNRRGFFLHIPFPSLDFFRKLPWRRQIIDGLLDFDLIAFQTDRDRHNFLQCAEALAERFTVATDGPQVTHVRFLKRTAAGANAWRTIQIATLPISIDYSKMAADAASARVQHRMTQLRADLQERQMILGVDRLDYTKGILHRLRALRLTLERHPELRGKIILVQHLVPSRESIGDYAQLRRDVEQLVSEINGQFRTPDWVPVQYLYHSLSREDLLAYYRTANIALITPLKDGMNLVAKEYCAAQIDEDGVLILSELAGAAAELQVGALLVNPHDIECTAERIYQALVMPRDERLERMQRLRRTIRNHDVFQWAEAFLTAAAAPQAPVSKGAQMDSTQVTTAL
ncbi:Alpha,alpha-trehalose-phosphate synthase, UDP-forming [Nitrococcus mobilis Nb-231]|uniref:Alpha,alpha-trehalose-phosphate synthase, UDP-forming n=1 Tax=Nitrococcus mobilis Nb-231 TaxID=314278 RepID=A4BQ98_9GAMM|nr:Alpha,alpha-trehalose-phosphate synthase, UDP-forming [Nitrococcus mobilis Nb-231]